MQRDSCRVCNHVDSWFARQRKLQNELVENGGSLDKSLTMCELVRLFLCCITQWKRLLKFAFIVVCANVGQGYTNISQPVNYNICPVKLFHIGENTMICHAFLKAKIMCLYEIEA